MKNSTKLSIAAAALSGLLMGTAARAASLPSVPAKDLSIQKALSSSIDPGQKAIKFDDADKDKEKDKAKDKHDCKGKNECKGHGGCKTDKNECKGKNDCKGKGGCNTNKEEKK